MDTAVKEDPPLYCYCCGVRYPASAYPAHYDTDECKEARKNA